MSSNGLNRVQLIGNIAEPDVRTTQSGQTVLKLRLAVTETYLDKTNTRQERTEWVPVSLFGKRAEALSKFIEKGQLVYVEGRFHTSSYEKDGEKRYSTEVNADDIKLLGSRRGNNSNQENEETPF